MSRPLMLFVILAVLVLCANSGHIYSHDIIISPNNKNSQSDITIIFTPETTLATTDYLRLIFPFELTAIKGTYWDIYTDCSDTQPSTNIASITESNLPDDTNTFFLQFYNGKDHKEPANLFGNVTYILRIIATPVDSGNSDLTLPVQIFTISNNSTNWIVYDANTAFGLVSLADAYPNSLIASLTIPYSQNNSKILGANYTAIIEITPTIAVENQGRIDIQLTNPAFTILSCDSATKQDQNDIQEIAVNFQQLASNSIRAIILEPLPANNGEMYSFTCTIQNPTTSALSSIKAQSRMAFAETIVEAGSSPSVLEAALLASSDATAFWDEDFHSVQLAWGYQASMSTALSVFSLYKDASASEVWYQSMKTTFKPRTSVTSTDKLQILVSTLNDAGFRVLASTIYHNLPDYSDTEKVSCALVTQGFITCSNVGQLQAQKYFVAFRFAVLSITGLTTAPDFGKVQVKTQTGSPLTLISLSQTTLANQEIGTNVPLFTSTGSQGVIAYASLDSGSTVRDYVSTDEDITLNLRFKYFTSQIIPLVLTQANMGIEFYTSSALPSVTSPTCSIASLTEATDIQTANCAVAASTDGYTKLSFRIVQLLNNATDSAAAALFLATPNDGTISFSTLRFSSSHASSLSYINENIYDYYARWVQGYDNSNIPSLSTAQSSSPFFFNSLVYRAGGLADVQAGASFFIASQTAGGIGNAGTDFPTLIRITGSLSATEQTNADKLLLFFNNLEPLNTETPCFSGGSSDIQCTYSDNGLIENTGTNDLTDYSGARRMEIKTDFTNSFNIYIPVQTIATYNTIGFFIAAASSVNDTTTGREYLLTQYIKRVDATTYTATITGDTVPIDAPSASTPKLVIPTGAGAGDLINSFISNARTTYGTTANSGTSVGAAYAYCSKYNFAVSDTFAFTALSGSNQETSSCVNLHYISSWNQEIICEVCPVDTTMPPSGNLPVTNFKLPTLTGADYSGSVYIVGSSNGALVKAASDNQTEVLTPFVLASQNLTFTPENIRFDSKNILSVFSFTPTFFMPQNISIVLKPASPSTSFLMTPLSAFGCKILSIEDGVCSVTGNDTYIQITATSGTATWPVLDHSIQFMVDSEASSITEDTTISYEATIYVDGVSAFSAVHDTSDTAQYTIDIEPHGSINLTQASYLFANEGARTVVFISFEVPNDTNIYQGQQLIFNIGNIAAENLGEIPSCVVRDQSTNQISTSFTSCNVTDLTNIIVIPKEQATGTFTLELGFLKVPVSSSEDNNITLKLVSIDGITTVATSENITLPVSYPSAQSTNQGSFVTYNRLYSNPGDVAEISFTIKPSVQAISLKSQVYVYFPSYYSPKLGYKNIWCTANDLPLTCSVIRSRVLNFASFPKTVKTGSSVVVKVYGVITPTVPVPAQTLFIAMDNDLQMDQLVEYAEFSDIASIPYQNRPLEIHDFFASTSIIRDAADYSIIFTTDLDGVKANTVIAIDFPDRFGNTLRGQQGPTVFISRTGSKLGSEVQTISFGSRFKITLPINLDPQTSYTFRIKSVVNPDYPTCNMDRPMFIIANSDETAAKYRTLPATWNGQFIDYLAKPGLKTLSMVDVNGSRLTNITLSVGTYSQEIRITPPNNESFNSEITFATTTNDVTLLPAILTAVRGSSYLSFRVGVPLDFTAQTILLTFSKDESSIYQVYSPLPHLELTFTNNLNNLLPTPPISIMKGGKSLLYEWKLDDLGIIPYTDLSIKVKVNNQDTSPLSIVGKSKITFTPDSPSAGFIFALDSSADAANPPSFTLSLSGTDASMYHLESDQIVVTVTEPISDAPVLNNLVVPSNYAPTRQSVTVNVDQSVSLYWYIAIENNLKTSDCSAIISTYQAGVQFDSLSGKQDQYGAVYMYNANQDYDFVISNLISNQAYSFIMCFENQLAHISSVTGTFTTMNNQATLDLVTIKFSDNINRNQLTSILCFFNQELQLPNLNVVAMDGTSCEVPSPFDSFGEFDYSKIVLYIYGERRSDQISDTTAQLQDYVQIITQQNSSSFLTDFNQAFSGANILDIFRSITVQTDITYASPVLVSGNPSISAGATSLTLSGLALRNGEGFFYGIADLSKNAAPTISQVRTMTNANDIYVSGDAVHFTSGSESLIFTGLEPSTKYTIYYYGTNRDRTQYAATTEMKAVDVYTLYGALLEGRVLFVLIAVLCMLIL